MMSLAFKGEKYIVRAVMTGLLAALLGLQGCGMKPQPAPVTEHEEGITQADSAGENGIQAAEEDSMAAEEAAGSAAAPQEENSGKQYPFADKGVFDEARVAEVSEYQRLKVLSKEGDVLLEEKDPGGIADFLNRLEMAGWEVIDVPPAEAEGICSIIRSASPKGAGEEAIEDIEWITVTRKDGMYYLSSMTPDGCQPDDTTCRIGMSYYRIPEKAGKYLESLNPQAEAKQ